MPPKQSPTAPERTKAAHPTISDVAMQLASRTNPPQSKVSLSRNAKGDVQIEVEVGATVATVAADQAAAIFDKLCTDYPRGENGNGAT